jgi:hypothetical protein
MKIAGVTVITVAGPIIMSAYLGVAEAAHDLALQHLQRKRDDPEVWYLLGELKNALATAGMAVQAMVDLCADYAFTPDVATVNAVLVRKTIAAQAFIGRKVCGIDNAPLEEPYPSLA